MKKKNSVRDTSTTPFCEFCQMTGHLHDKYFCLYNYLEWPKIFGKPKSKPRNQQNKGKSQANSVILDKNS